MSDNAASFVGKHSRSIMTAGSGRCSSPISPKRWQSGSPPLTPQCVLETCAGTGIVTRRLRDLLPAGRNAHRHRPKPADARGGAREVQTRRDGRVPAGGCDGLAVPRPQLRRARLSVRHHVFPGQGEVLSRGLSRALGRAGIICSACGTRTASTRRMRRSHELLAELFPDDPPRFYRGALRLSPHRSDPRGDERGRLYRFPGGGAAHRPVGRRPGGVCAGLRLRQSARRADPRARRRSGAACRRARRDAASRIRRGPPRMPMQVIFFEATRP